MKESIQPNAIYSTKEAANLLEIHPYTFQALVRKGEIKAKRISAGYRIMGHDLISYIHQHD